MPDMSSSRACEASASELLHSQDQPRHTPVAFPLAYTQTFIDRNVDKKIDREIKSRKKDERTTC